MYIVEKERKGAQCTCRRMEKVPKIGRQFLHTYDKEFSVGISYDCNNISFACRENVNIFT
jgi:hypothetical protein